MADERPLYEDSQLLVDYLPNGIKEHFLLIKPDGNYLLPRGCLEKFATTSRDELELEIENISRNMIYEARERGLGVADLCLAIAQAYIEEERRKEINISKMKYRQSMAIE